ncbi:MAG: acyl-[acyl-carrier-protein]--UDP-N-acetylglucosamine O-acyltransferase [Methylothermaceae bacteria B42]|nr:MAG: acyl-[acyl-carrier-protein]--UDP-N-acetylglucosamine O-acyltransferase [Methylothermaceae bacteria B42]HHJ40321.1 acyl-ACP--UDP-N-acetylglucosamine O-acyltransferase [Methylothermaceae bacterium]
MTAGNFIHPSSQIDKTVHLGRRVVIGPFVVVEPGVTIGDGCVIDAHAVIRRGVKLRADNRIHPHVVLGGLPQDLGFKESTRSWLEVGSGNTFREGVTVSRASAEEGVTKIGDNNYFMNHSHVGHDCQVGDNNILASGVALGGFVEVGDRVFFGGGAMVHQFCRIGSLAMIRGTSGVSKDVLPFTLVGGLPVKHYRLNTVGLRRAGINGERYRVLSIAFRRLRHQQGLEDLPETEEIIQLRNWLAVPSKRGMHGFV